MFFPLTSQLFDVVRSLPASMAIVAGKHRGIRYSMTRKAYGQTLVRMTATSLKTGRTHEISIGLAQSMAFNRPELRVDFVQIFQEEPGRGGRWMSPFNARDPQHVAIIEWAAEAFMLAVTDWALTNCPTHNIQVAGVGNVPLNFNLAPMTGGRIEAEVNALLAARRTKEISRRMPGVPTFVLGSQEAVAAALAAH